MRIYALAFVGVCLAASASAAPLLVDDFSSITPQSVTQWGVGQSAAYAAGGTMLGGSRGLLARVTTSNFGLQSSIQIVPGVGAVSDNTGNAGTFFFAYLAVSGDSSNVYYSFGTNYNMGGSNGFEFDMLSSDKPFDLQVNLYSDGSVERWRKSFGSISSPTTIAVSSSDYLNGSSDHGNIDAIAFLFDTQVDGDLSLREIRMVPEPASMAVLGLGLLALKRRKKA